MESDAVVVGAGPNGLAAAITLARAGLSVTLIEGAATIGGGCRSEELTEPGFLNDVCSAVHPLAVTSPFFHSLPLKEFGLRWIFPPLAVAHPISVDRAVVLVPELKEEARLLETDGPRYRQIFSGWLAHAPEIFAQVLGPFSFPRSPLLLADFGIKAIRSAERFAAANFRTVEARALFAGVAAHSFLPLSQPLSAAVALVLMLAAHSAGWPIPEGGSQQIATALGRYFASLGGKIVTGTSVSSISALPSARAYLFDLTPRQFVAIAGERVSESFRTKLLRFKQGPGVFKIDWALDRPVPWGAEECAQAATVHLGGTFEEIAASESQVSNGTEPPYPYVLAVQPSLFDPSRAPLGKHTLWTYCHVPNGSKVDMTSRIEAQIERFAPGFSKTVIAKHRMFPADLEQRNANYIGGDISGGAINFRQLFARPVSVFHPYRMGVKGLYLCSSSTPPGAGVHGMCGYHAAIAALKDLGVGE